VVEAPVDAGEAARREGEQAEGEQVPETEQESKAKNETAEEVDSAKNRIHAERPEEAKS
jgi:hypothetical protein